MKTLMNASAWAIVLAALALCAGCGETEWCSWRVVLVYHEQNGKPWTLVERIGYPGVRARTSGVLGEPQAFLMLRDEWPHECEVPR